MINLLQNITDGKNYEIILSQSIFRWKVNFFLSENVY